MFLDLCQGLGLGAAAGIRPFFPAILVGLFAMGDLGVDFDDTSYAFLESPVWLVALAIVLVISFVLARRESGAPAPAMDAALAGIAIGIGALLSVGTLADHGRDSAAWTAVGLVGGGAAAALATAAVRDLAGRTAQRLDPQARRALPLWFEGVGLLVAGISLGLPPAALLVLAFLAWLLIGGRRREGGKYAGLRVLR